MGTEKEMGARLKSRRLKAGLRQRDVAKALDVTEAHISKWESNTCKPSFDNLCMLADFFGVTLDYLMTGRETNSVCQS